MTNNTVLDTLTKKLLMYNYYRLRLGESDPDITSVSFLQRLEDRKIVIKNETQVVDRRIPAVVPLCSTRA